MLPWEQDVSDGGAVAVNAEKAERQGDLRHQRAMPLDEEEDESERESRQQRQKHLMISTETQHKHTTT